MSFIYYIFFGIKSSFLFDPELLDVSDVDHS